MEIYSPLFIVKVQLIQIDRIVFLCAVSVHLVIDGHAVPTGVGGRIVTVHLGGDVIQRDGNEVDVVIRGTFGLDDEMIPGAALGIARNSALHPMHGLIVPSVPLVPTSNAALVPPDIGLSIDELIDVEFQGLRNRRVSNIEINVVCELVIIGNALLVRQASGEFLVPKNVGKYHVPTQAELHGLAA